MGVGKPTGGRYIWRMTLDIHQFPCLQDNYGFLVRDTATGQVAAIDTPDAQEILRQLQQKGWTLDLILNTHWHPDHAGGNVALKTATGAHIFAPIGDQDKIEGVDRWLHDGDIISLGQSQFEVLHCPGHTHGHILYHAPQERLAFVGDVIFKMGCGRVFEGTMAEMHHSLQRIGALPPETTLYCAHEYSEANAAFACAYAPDDPAVQTSAEQIQATRAQGQPTVPTTVADEHAHNLFLRAKTVAEFTAVRQAKDAF